MEKIDKNKKIDMLKKMLMIRCFELKIVELVDSYEIYGPVHTCIGQEAEIVGTCSALKLDDYIIGNHRSHGYMIAKGADIKKLMAEVFGKSTGTNKGKGGSMHLSDKNVNSICATGIVGSGIPIACGSALTSKIKNDGKVSVVFFGDGAANEGTAHESMNLAAIWDLPVIFMLENNGVAVTMIAERSSKVQDLSIRANGYGILGEKVDGQDVEKVYNRVLKATEYCRNGNGPVLIEAKTYRFNEHGEGNAYRELWKKNYRNMKENMVWKKEKDPIGLYKSKLIKEHIIEENEFNILEMEIKKIIEEAVKYAKNSPEPELRELYNDVF